MIKLKLKEDINVDTIGEFVASGNTGNLSDFFYIMSMLSANEKKYHVMFYDTVVDINEGVTKAMQPCDNSCYIPLSWLEK